MNPAQPDGFLALPDSGDGAPVLVLHAWWGLNAAIRELCERLAAEGFIAFAPDLYRGEVADTIEGAQQLSRALDDARATQAVAQAAAFLAERTGREVAVVGFSLGAYFALEAARTLPEQVAAVVLFYGTGEGDHSTARAAYLGHFAEQDEYEPREYVDAQESALRDAGRPVQFHHYPDSKHWFFEPDRPEYNPAAAQLAWERTLDFLRAAQG